MSNILNAFLCTGVDDLQPWMRWGYYISPMTYGQNAIAINEFLDERWNTVSSTIIGSSKNQHKWFDIFHQH